MADIAEPFSQKPSRSRWVARLIASRRFQKWAAGFPLTKRIVRREGEAMFDLIAGFCHSQVLMALVKFEIPQALIDGPMSGRALAMRSSVPYDRMQILLKASVSLGFL